jgi:hypothetical protein
LRAYALTVDVRHEHVVAEFSQLAGGFFLVSADASPLVDDEDCRAFARECIIIGLPAFADDVTRLIFNGFFNDGRAEWAEEGDRGQGSAAETG